MLDASLVVELLVNRSDAVVEIKQRLYQTTERFAIPHLLDIEVVSALRKLNLAGHLLSENFGGYLRELAAIKAIRYSHEPLLGRIWELRQNFSAYDATYIALAEDLGATLYTTDAKLRSGHCAKVVYLGGWVI